MFEFLYHNKKSHGALYLDVENLSGRVLTPYYSGQFKGRKQFTQVLEIIESDYNLKEIIRR